MNKHFIRTADQETANILKSIGFPQVGYTKGIYTFANCSSWSYVKKKYKLNTTNFLFLCNC